MPERILTLHPEAEKHGVNIDKSRYDLIRTAILEAVGAQPGLTFNQLTEAMRQSLAGRFDGSINWYVTTVKLDLEARGLIERIPKTSPQQLRLVQN
jgi:hypothetical protein